MVPYIHRSRPLNSHPSDDLKPKLLHHFAMQHKMRIRFRLRLTSRTASVSHIEKLSAVEIHSRRQSVTQHSPCHNLLLVRSIGFLQITKGLFDEGSPLRSLRVPSNFPVSLIHIIGGLVVPSSLIRRIKTDGSPVDFLRQSVCRCSLPLVQMSSPPKIPPPNIIQPAIHLSNFRPLILAQVKRFGVFFLERLVPTPFIIPEIGVHPVPHHPCEVREKPVAVLTLHGRHRLASPALPTTGPHQTNVLPLIHPQGFVPRPDNSNPEAIPIIKEPTTPFTKQSNIKPT